MTCICGTHSFRASGSQPVQCRCVSSWDVHTRDYDIHNPLLYRLKKLRVKCSFSTWKPLHFSFSSSYAGDLDYYWLDPATWHSRETSPISSVSIWEGDLGIQGLCVLFVILCWYVIDSNLILLHFTFYESIDFIWQYSFEGKNSITE